HEAVLRVAADALADVEAHDRAVGADGLAADAEALEGLAEVAGGRVIQQPVVVEGLEPELLVEDEAVRDVAEDRFLRADGSAADSVDALRAEKAELVFREAVETRAVEVVELEPEALELRQVEALADRAAERGEGLLVRVVFGEIAPRLPRRPLRVVVKAGDGIAPARVLQRDRGADEERVARHLERCRGVFGALIGEVAKPEVHVDLAELQEGVAWAQVEIEGEGLDRFGRMLDAIAVHRI